MYDTCDFRRALYKPTASYKPIPRWRAVSHGLAYANSAKDAHSDELSIRSVLCFRIVANDTALGAL